MKAALSVLLLLSLAGPINAENLPTPASSTAISGSTGASTTTANRSVAPAPARAERNALTEQFKQDLAYCRTLAVEERRNCERETYAARAEGLYR